MARWTYAVYVWMEISKTLRPLTPPLHPEVDGVLLRYISIKFSIVSFRHQGAGSPLGSSGYTQDSAVTDFSSSAHDSIAIIQINNFIFSIRIITFNSDPFDI